MLAGHLVCELEGEAGQQRGKGSSQGELAQRLAHAVASALRKGEVALCALRVACSQMLSKAQANSIPRYPQALHEDNACCMPADSKLQCMNEVCRLLGHEAIMLLTLVMLSA